MTANVLDQCGLGVAFVDSACVVRHATMRFAELLGLASVEIGLALSTVVDIPPDLSEAIAEGVPWRGVLSERRAGEAAVFFELVPFLPGAMTDVAGGVLIARQSGAACGTDASERHWASMKRFAGGLSHEFNNALASIQGFAEIAESAEPCGSPMVGRCLANILRGCEQARESIARARVVGGKADLQSAPENLGKLVTVWTQASAASLPERVQLQLDVQTELPTIMVDSTLLERAFAALWQNALQALEGGGVLRVAVQSGGSIHWPVVLEVRDTGCGMAPDVLELCTEPYFSTREAIGGKGLGLALAYGVIRAHGGRISVDSALERGTVVRLWFSACTARCNEERKTWPEF